MPQASPAPVFSIAPQKRALVSFIRDAVDLSEPSVFLRRKPSVSPSLGPSQAPRYVRSELLIPLVLFFRLLVHGSEKSVNSGEVLRPRPWRRREEAQLRPARRPFPPEAISAVGSETERRD